MAVPTDPFPDFRNGIDDADGDKVDARFKAIYDTLNPSVVGLDSANFNDGALSAAKLTDATVTSAKIADATIVLADMATPALNAWLKLLTAADVKFAFGQVAVPPTFSAGNQATVNVAHGLGGVPIAAWAMNTKIAGANNSSGVTQLVAVGIDGVDATNLAVRLSIMNGATSGVGADPFYWFALR